MRERILSLIIVCLFILSLPITAFAHSGRTDGRGGHKDNKNKSGLGRYHYHCGGYPPHLHTSGVCPYRGGAGSSSKRSSYSSTPKPVYATRINAVNIPGSINAGESATLKAAVYPSNAEDKTVYWESSNPSVLSVSLTGELTAVGVGTATITAKTSRGTSKKFNITVKEVFADSINISDNKDEILLGDSEYLKCVFMPQNTTNKAVQWASSDENVLSVSADGRIIGKGVGVATVTATHKELTDTLVIEVKPIDAKSVELILPDDIERNEAQTPRIKKNSTLQIQAIIEPENATYKEIEWSVSDETVASIDGSGLLTAYETGTVVITATAVSGVSEEIEIEIYSDIGYAVAGVGGAVAIAAGGATWYYRKKKKKAEAE